MNKHQFGPWWLLLFFWAELCFMELVVHAATAPQFWQPELVLLMLYPARSGGAAVCAVPPVPAAREPRARAGVQRALLHLLCLAARVLLDLPLLLLRLFPWETAGQVMQFWKVTLHAIRKNWLPLSLMLLPPWATPCSESAFRRRGCAFRISRRLRRWPPPCISA